MYNEFITPPKGYGNVPFYWWNGDKLDKNRISYQLEKLAENGVSGVQINFAHHCPQHSPDMKGGGFGKTYSCDPEAFSPEWWDIVNFTFRKAKSLNMGVGISDYTIGWIGNGYFIDKVVYDNKLYATELVCDKIILKKGDNFNVSKSPDTLNITAIYSNYEEAVNNDFIAKDDCTVYQIKKVLNKNSVDILNPESGKLLCELFFKNFENNLDEDVKDVLNYCFQDEFIPNCDTHHLWGENLDKKFKESFGYDIKPRLHDLFVETKTCVKTRLDYADIKTELTEEGYFKPIYDFHEKRGLIYGCDQCSRGYNPGEYGDYFRTTRWFSAPGNDTPFRQANLIKDKVSSSIAHLYNRPRTWLEGYHSSGWGTSLSSLTSPTSDNFVYGMNLLCMHGLYYSTYGGFWEWAPPDFHFRMPYWSHAKSFFNYYERLSYLLTRGKHACDVAVFYPVSSCDVNLNSNKCVNSTFDIAKTIFHNGIDFDFIDHQSIEASEIVDGKLCISGEKYSVVILSNVDAIRSKTLEKLIDFSRNGGKFIVYQEAPKYTDILNDQQLDNIKAVTNTKEELLTEINKIKRDFYTADNSAANVHHRKTDDYDIYFIRNTKKGTQCSFKAEGTPEIWFANGNERKLLSYTEKDDYINVFLPFDEDNIIVFNKTDNIAKSKFIPLEKQLSKTEIEGDWEFELIPTLNNKYGDFRLPVDEEFIGAEIRFPEINGKKSIVSEYDIFNKVLPDGNMTTARINDRYGIVTGEIAEQGYHGLKEQIYDWNIVIPKGEKAVYYAYFTIEEDTEIEVLTDGILPNVVMIDADIIRNYSSIPIKQGTHRFSVEYINDENSKYGENGNTIKTRAFIVIKDKKVAETSTNLPLTNRWFANESIVRFSANKYEKTVDFKAETAPGLYKLQTTVFGEIIEAKIDKSVANIVKIGEKHNANIYQITTDIVSKSTSNLEMTIKPKAGYTGGAIFPEPIKQSLKKSEMPLGDISKIGGLESYSGIIRYKKTINLSTKKDKRLILNLGEVACSCEVFVNNKNVEILYKKPFNTEITEFINNGENMITIEVANTLCNHYSTNPSPYSNYPKDAISGLIGPVCIEEFDI